mmetsp:Transcript_8336/g.17823  ORF Transcript_8336/g.17823 Transcript_8336/m.17823 type:complete len:257 (+) Transcript_8336:1226-1996(+)
MAERAGGAVAHLAGDHGVLAGLAADVVCVTDDLAGCHAHLLPAAHQVLQQGVHSGVLAAAHRLLLARLPQSSRVRGRVLEEDGHGQVGIRLPLVCGRVGHGLQLDEGLAALQEEPIVEGGQPQEGVNLQGVQDVLVVPQVQCRAHRQVHVARVQLPVRQQPEVIGLSAPPRAVDALDIAHRGRLQGHQACQRLCGCIGHGCSRLPRGSRPIHHGGGCVQGVHLQGALLELVDLQGSQRVQLLHSQGVNLLGGTLLR